MSIHSGRPCFCCRAPQCDLAPRGHRPNARAGHSQCCDGPPARRLWTNPTCHPPWPDATNECVPAPCRRCTWRCARCHTHPSLKRISGRWGYLLHGAKVFRASASPLHHPSCPFRPPPFTSLGWPWPRSSSCALGGGALVCLASHGAGALTHRLEATQNETPSSSALCASLGIGRLVSAGQHWVVGVTGPGIWVRPVLRNGASTRDTGLKPASHENKLNWPQSRINGSGFVHKMLSIVRYPLPALRMRVYI